MKQKGKITKFTRTLIMFRKWTKISQRKLAKAIGVESSHISRLENGIILPSKRIVYALEKHFWKHGGPYPSLNPQKIPESAYYPPYDYPEEGIRATAMYAPRVRAFIEVVYGMCLRWRYEGPQEKEKEIRNLLKIVEDLYGDLEDAERGIINDEVVP